MKKIIGAILVAVFMPCLVFAQGRIIQGTITSASDGESLIGATITEKDAADRIISACITDFDGHYVLKIVSPENKLEFRFIGYETIVKEIGSATTIDVKMKEGFQSLNEYTVKAEKKFNDGTFPIPQRELSTATQTISAEVYEGVQVTSVDEALQGRIAGLDIVANSGDLGAGSSMRIRGTSSFNASSEPLIVVNNIPYQIEIDDNFDFSSANQEQYANMLSINPDDIEEITVLKDAASTAVWGSQGANGVLMIKTKRPVTGPTKLQYSYRITGAVQPQGLNMLNGDDYTMMIKQAYFNPRQSEDAANVIEFNYDPTFSEYENFNNNTDWVSEVTQVGIKHDHYINIYGGGEKARYRVSGGFLKQTGTIIGQSLDRINTTSMLDYSVSDRLKFISELSFTYSNTARSYTNLLGIAYSKMPNVSVYQQNADGTDTDVYYNISRTRSTSLDAAQRDLMNPVAVANLATNNAKNFRILPTFRLQYDLLDPNEQTLRYSMYVTFDVNNDRVSTFLPREVSNAAWDNGAINYATQYDGESMTVMADNSLTWSPRFQNTDHSLTLAGTFQIRTGNRTTHSVNSNLPSGTIVDASSEGFLSYIDSYRYSYRSNGLMARGHYAYKKRYVLGFTFRRDGSTKFGDGNKYGNFPAVSAKWIISDEPFMMGANNWLSMLAIRPSYGLSGNQPSSEYLHFSRYTSYGDYIDMAATRPTSLRLTDLKWETTASLNIGVDMGFFRDKVTMDFNYYDNLTRDLLQSGLSVASSSGYSSISYQNVGTMRNQGWELNFYANRAIKVGDFTADFNFNLANNVNTIMDLREDVLESRNPDYDYNNGTYLSRIQVGNSFGSIYGFKYKGVYQYSDYIPGTQEDAPVARDEYGNVFTDEDGDPLPMYFAYGKANEYEFQGGDAKYEDINNDGNIDELDIVYLGNSNPKVYGGFGTTLRYKNLSLTGFFNFRTGNKIVNLARMNAENMYSLNNQSTSVNWRWRKDGDVTDMPRALYAYGYNWLGSDRYVEDGSFVRFKYLTLGYTLPKNTLNKLGLEKMSFYLTINNIWVWSKYTGVDPEVGYGVLGDDTYGMAIDNNRTPRSKDATLGVSVTF